MSSSWALRGARLGALGRAFGFMSYRKKRDPDRVDTELAELIQGYKPEDLLALKKKISGWSHQISKLLAQHHASTGAQEPPPPPAPSQVPKTCQQCFRWFREN